MTPEKGSSISPERHRNPAQRGSRGRALDRPFRTLAILGSAAVATSSGVQPTGIAWYDFWVLVGVGVAVPHIVRRTPTIVWAIAAAVAALSTGLVGIAGQLLLSVATIAGWRALGPFRRRPTKGQLLEYHELLVACASVGATASLLRLQDVFVGYSSAAIVSVVLVVSVAVALPQFTPRARRVATLGSAVLAVAAFVIACGTWLSVRSLQVEVGEAASAARQGAQLLRKGDTDAALENLNLASDELDRIGASLGGTWPTLALGVPLVSQNLQAARTTTASAGRLVTASQSLGESAAFDELLSDGTFDLQRIEELRNAIGDIERELELGSVELAQTSDAWIAPQLQTELSKFSDEVTKAADALRTVDQLVDILPGLLGADTERSYLVLVTNPSEARELGGFAGGYAVVKANDGVLEVSQSGRAAQLNHSPTTADALTPGQYPQRFLEHQPWKYGQNFTAMKDLPSLTRALAELVPSMTGHQIDGLLYLDPFALEALVALTGPVTIDSHNLTLSEQNTAEFFLTGQYEDFADQADRTAVFEQLIKAFFARLSNETSVNSKHIDRLVDVVRQDRLSFATLDPVELAALEDIGVAGSFGRSSTDDFLAVSHLNAAPNKLDAYLKREISYDAEIDPITGAIETELTITLHNEAPDGLSDYVGGNRKDLPFGTNRAVLVVHTPHQLIETTKSPEPAFTRTFREFELFRYEQIVIIPKGESRTVTLKLTGNVATGPDYRLRIDHQPLVHPDEMTVIADSLGTRQFPLTEDIIVTSADTPDR